MRLILWAATLVILGLPAHAEVMDGSEIAKQAQKCWSLIDRERAKGFSATFEARVDQFGLPEFRMTGYTPENRDGKFMAAAAKRTLQKCSPFKGVSAGLYRFEMIYEDPFDE